MASSTVQYTIRRWKEKGTLETLSPWPLRWMDSNEERRLLRTVVREGEITSREIQVEVSSSSPIAPPEHHRTPSSRVYAHRQSLLQLASLVVRPSPAPLVFPAISRKRLNDHELTTEHRAAIIATRNAGATYDQIAGRYCCSVPTVANTVKLWTAVSTSDSLKKKVVDSQAVGKRIVGSHLTVEHRAAIIAARGGGATIAQLAEQYCCNRDAIHRTLKRWRDHKTTARLQTRRYPQHLSIHDVFFSSAQRDPDTAPSPYTYRLTSGKHKGKLIAEVPRDYLIGYLIPRAVNGTAHELKDPQVQDAVLAYIQAYPEYEVYVPWPTKNKADLTAEEKMARRDTRKEPNRRHPKRVVTDQERTARREKWKAALLAYVEREPEPGKRALRMQVVDKILEEYALDTAWANRSLTRVLRSKYGSGLVYVTLRNDAKERQRIME